MLAITVATMASFEMVLFGEALVSLGSEVKVAIFNGYVLFGNSIR